MEQMTDLIKRLKACVRWYKRIEEGYVQEKEKLQSELEASEKKYNDTGVFYLFISSDIFENKLSRNADILLKIS